MSGPRENDLPPDRGLASDEPSSLAGLASRLERERPVPRDGFRAMLRRRLLEEGREQGVVRRGLQLRVAAYAGSGISLLAVAALSVSGVGPLAAG